MTSTGQSINDWQLHLYISGHATCSRQHPVPTMDNFQFMSQNPGKKLLSMWLPSFMYIPIYNRVICLHNKAALRLGHGWVIWLHLYTRSMNPKNKKDLNQGVLHFWRTNLWLMDGHTQRQSVNDWQLHLYISCHATCNNQQPVSTMDNFQFMSQNPAQNFQVCGLLVSCISPL